MAYTLIGFARCRGGYDPDALQVLNRRSRGGVCWYRGGWHIRATVSWALGALVGLLAVSVPSYEGPLLSVTGEVDCSFLLSGVVGGLVHLALSPKGASHGVEAGQELARAESGL